MQRRSLLVALLTVAVLSACGNQPTGDSTGTDSPGTSDIQKLTVGMIPVAHFSPVYIAQQQGFFEEEGLEVETQVIQNAAAITPSVINGQLQIGTTAGTPFINSVAKGLPVIGVAPAGANPGSAEQDTIAILVAGDGPTTLAELSGKTMAVNAQGSQPHIAAAKVFLDAGLNPAKVKTVAMPMPDAIAALTQGTVDAAAVAEPFVTLGLKQGSRILTPLYSEAFSNDGTESLYFASQEFVDSNREQVDAFNRAIIKANTLANEDPTMLETVLVSDLGMEAELAQKMTKPTFGTDRTTATLEEISQVMVETGFLEEAVPGDRLFIQ